MKWKNLLKLLFTVAFIVWLARSQDWGLVARTLAHMDRWLFALGMVISLSMIPMQAVRWLSMLGAGTRGISFSTVFRYTALGFFANLFLPSAIGGDAVKSLALGRATQSMAASVATTLLARLLGMLVLQLVFWAVLGLYPHYAAQLGVEISAMLVIGGGYLVAGTAYFLLPQLTLSLRFPLAARLNRFLVAIWAFRTRLDLLGKAMAWSLLIQLANVAFAYLTFRCLQPDLVSSGTILAIPLMIILSMVPVTILNVGVKESLAIFFLGKLAGLPSEVCVAGTFIGYIAALLQSLPGFYYFYCSDGKRALTARAMDKGEQAEQQE